MKSLILLTLIGLAYCAPQWPYRDSMQPYYYGYPGQTPYVYRPQIEDDEGDDVPTGRQDLPVVSGGQDNLGNSQSQQLNPVPLNVENSPVVVETGSAAPVIPQQQSGTPQQTNKNQQPLNAQAPPNVNNPTGLREPPPFPPATTPRPQKTDEDDSEEEDEDEDEDADADADAEDEEQQSEESEEEEEDRRRQEPINNKSMSEEDEVVTTPAPTQPPPPPNVINDTVLSSTEDVEEVVKDIVTPDSKKHPVRIEALVPGYVTDQGEVLVPVDTVTGDQPISIVPDPYTPPARGIPASQFDDSPYFYAQTLRRNHPIRRTHFRQEGYFL